MQSYIVYVTVQNLAGYFSLSTQLAHIQMVSSTQRSLLRLSELSKKQEVVNLAGNLHNST